MDPIIHRKHEKIAKKDSQNDQNVVVGLKDFVPAKENADYTSVFKKMTSWLTSHLYADVINMETVPITTNSGALLDRTKMQQK